MAKYTITYACGHTGIVNLCGPIKDRERKIAYYENECNCPDCIEDAKIARGNSITDLEGTPKQKAWAFDIRAEFKAKIYEALNHRLDVEVPAWLASKGLTLETLAQQEREGFEILSKARDRAAEILKNTSAKWWIDNRNGAADNFLPEFLNRFK